MASVKGPAWARVFDEANRVVFAEHEAIAEEGRRVGDVHTIEDEGTRHVVRATHIPLWGDHGRGVLMIIDNVTELMEERERREEIMHQLVTTLVTLVGRADPFSAHQSARAAEVAVAIAEEMGLNERDVRTIEIAGNLMNL